MTTLERIIIEVFLGVIACAGIVLYLEHRGAARIEAADAKALAAAQKQEVAEAALERLKASSADQGASIAQQAVDAYRSSHPEQPVVLCHPSDPAAVPKARAIAGKFAGPGPGSAVIREVPAGAAGPDIRVGLDALVQAAQRLGILYADLQNR